MKIECTIKRAGGTKDTIDGTEYHFAPLVDGCHVADVLHKGHAGRFLSIAEAYQLYDGSAPVAAPVIAKDPEPAVAPVQEPATGLQILLGSNDHPATFDIAGKAYQLGDIVRLAFEASGMTTDEWNAQDDDTRASQIDEQLDALEGDGGETKPEQKLQDAADRAELVEQYTAKFGKAPKASMKNDTLRTKLAAGN